MVGELLRIPAKDLLRVPGKDIRRLFHGLSKNLNPPTFPGSRRSVSLSESVSDDTKASLLQDGSSHNSAKVPRGFLAVYVGQEMRRYVIPASCINLPDFRVLMECVEKEFGFEHEGAIKFPCEIQEFEAILVRCYTKHDKIKSMVKKKERSLSIVV